MLVAIGFSSRSLMYIRQNTNMPGHAVHVHNHLFKNTIVFSLNAA